MKVREAGDFGAIARERRRELGLTQAELAERVGLTRQWIVRFEQGNIEVSLSKAFAVLRELDLVVRTAAIEQDSAKTVPTLKFKIPAISLPRFDASVLRGANAISSMDTQKLISELRERIKEIDATKMTLPRAFDE